MTTITQIQLVTPTFLANADTSLYTSPTSTTSKIGRAVFTNTSASAVTITAGIASSGSLGATVMISARTLAPGEAYVSPELSGAVIPSGQSLHAFSSVNGAVTFTASGQIIQ